MSQDVGDLWLDRAINYAKAVRSGERVECRYVQLAVERWFDDLENGHKRGLYFDENAAARYFRFVYKYCRHYIGEFAGKPIELQPWQCFIEANVHGWVRANGRRRFKIVHEEIARKQGKSTRLAASGNYYLIADREAAAQVYIAASKREQTKEIFDAAVAMINRSPVLSRRAKPYKQEVHAGESKMLRLSKDSKSMDGFNTHAALVDELHAHKDSSVWDVLRSSMGARRQPIMRGITTAGFDRKGFAYTRRGYVIKVLERVVEDDELFGIIYTVDDPEKWEDEEEWFKANPNLGVSTDIEDMRSQFREAREIPTAKVEFLTKRLNIWTYSQTSWMRMDKWDACRDPHFDTVAVFEPGESAPEFANWEVYGGLDLSSVEDICSFSLCFAEGKKRYIAQRGYLPQAAMERRLSDGDRTLEAFRDRGYLVVIPGEVIDYDFIKRDIMTVCERYDVKGIAFDRWNSSQLVNDLMGEGVPMVKFGQGFQSMSAPMKDVMRLTLCGDIVHNDSLLSWAMSNVVATLNPAGDIKPDKSKSSEKIDPAVSTIMAVALAMGVDEEESFDSIYNHTSL